MTDYHLYECRFSLDGIANFQTVLSITNSLTMALTPVRLHFVSSVRIPHSVHNFRNLIPLVKLQPLNLGVGWCEGAVLTFSAGASY